MSRELKPFQTFEEQVEKIKAKKFEINNEEELLDFLQMVNYYRLSAYFKYYSYKNLDFNNVRMLYEFDMRIRSLLFQVIEEIEIFWKTQISYMFSLKNGKQDIY